MPNTISTASSLIDIERRKADRLNQEPGDLTGYDCSECMNRGYIWKVSDFGELYTEQCRCVIQRRNKRYLRESGLESVAERYTFEDFRASERWQDELLRMARGYAEKPEGWFFLGGRPGTGKTHLCTAICTELMRKGHQTRYLLWRDFSARAKAVVNDPTYDDIVEPVKKARVLYMDDLFKTGKGQEPTTGDVNLAFEIINARYNDEKKLTIISSELNIRRIMEIDESIGSRIYQRAKGHYADLSKMQNYRLRK